MRHLLLSAVALICLSSECWAGTPAEESLRDLDDIEVAVVTYGPGDHAFTRFGHNAIWVRHLKSGRDKVYNFGTLDIGSESLVRDFLAARLRYWVSVTDKEGAFTAYQRENRSIFIQVLSLSLDEKSRLLRSLRNSVLPENRYYIYHYYTNNCSTRVRDLIDEATAGRLRQAGAKPAKMTWRQHTRRLTQSDWPFALGLHLLLSGETDRAVSGWEEMFLPSVLRETVRLVSAEADRSSSLVKKEYSLHRANRASLPIAPQRYVGLALTFGLALFVLTLSIARLSTASLSLGPSRLVRVSRWGMGAVFFLLNLVSGLLGSVFLFFWWGTSHEIAHFNANLFFLSPASLLLLLVSVTSLKWRFVARALLPVAGFSALAASIGCLLALTGLQVQDTSEVAALMTPIWIAQLGALLLLRADRKATEAV